jgi:hypothetical protein
MTFDELLLAVTLETKRPDLLEDGTISQKIREVTLGLHTMDFFVKDIREAQIVFPEKQFIQKLDTSTIPNYRKLSYFRRDDPIPVNPAPILPPLYTTQRADALFKVIDVTNIFDPYQAIRTNVCYQAGNSLNIRAELEIQFALMGYYASPDIRPDFYESWIADELPYAIINKATSAIFALTGKQEMSRKYDDPQTGIVAEWVRKVQMAGIEGEGR